MVIGQYTMVTGRRLRRLARKYARMSMHIRTPRNKPSDALRADGYFPVMSASGAVCAPELRESDPEQPAERVR